MTTVSVDIRVYLDWFIAGIFLFVVYSVSVRRERAFVHDNTEPSLWASLPDQDFKWILISLYQISNVAFWIFLYVSNSAIWPDLASTLDLDIFFNTQTFIAATTLGIWLGLRYVPVFQKMDQVLLERSSRYHFRKPLPRKEVPSDSAERSPEADEADEHSGRRRSIADRLVSDRPLRAGDPDPLGYGNLARGISGFLRNEQTQTPLTLAIVGAWGTGKSSIMSLLKADLEKHGYRPVWFNAWHHQTEEHFLASLLETLRVAAFPGWWTVAGLVFRLRLFWIRAKRKPGIFVVILGLLALQLGLIASGAGPEFDKMMALVSDNKDKPETIEAVAALPGVGALLAFLLTMRVRLRNTLLDPARLTASVGRLTRVAQFRDRLSFRHRFGGEFRDVAQALAPLTPVILVDDLDRCRPERVLEVLEAINFLVSSGECVVVMGLERQRVIDSVAFSFKDVAAFVSADGPAKSLQSRKAQRRAFAENYLEKLVNVEVQVPDLPEAGALAILSEEQKQPTVASDHRPFRVRLASWKIYFPTLLGVFAAGGLAYGFGLILKGPSQDSPTVVATSAPVDQLSVVGSVSGLVALTLFALLVRAVRSQREALRTAGDVLDDSDEFVNALTDWYPLMATRLSTPRALKRFINRLRLLAMLLRGESEEPEADTIDESSLVAIASIDRCLPGSSNIPFNEAEFQDKDDREAFKKAKAAHVSRSKDTAWPPDSNLVKRFKKISSSVVTREEEPVPDVSSAKVGEPSVS